MKKSMAAALTFALLALSFFMDLTTSMPSEAAKKDGIAPIAGPSAGTGTCVRRQKS